jgi:hypothetical protein
MTSDVKKWPKEKQIAGNAKEALCVYTSFSSNDKGKSRKQVCWINPDHPDFEENRRLIVEAPQIRLYHDNAVVRNGQLIEQSVIQMRVIRMWQWMFMALALLSVVTIIIKVS